MIPTSSGSPALDSDPNISVNKNVPPAAVTPVVGGDSSSADATVWGSCCDSTAHRSFVSGFSEF